MKYVVDNIVITAGETRVNFKAATGKHPAFIRITSGMLEDAGTMPNIVKEFFKQLRKQAEISILKTNSEALLLLKPGMEFEL